MSEKNIEIIEQPRNILLIAPHGHRKSDINTGTLARMMAKRLQCSAVINEHYRRPYRDKHTGEMYRTNRAAGIVDLNDMRSIGKGRMTEAFLHPILRIAAGVLAGKGAAGLLVLHIHGIGDDKYRGENDAMPPVLIGIGRGRPDRLSARVETADLFLKALGEDRHHPVRARIEQGGGYSGWAEHNLNQLFTGRIEPDYRDDRVQSMQLEMKFTGYRNRECLAATADILSRAAGRAAELAEKGRRC